MTTPQSFRRVLIVADESADWIVAGVRQLDRIALSIDEFALENKETAPVLVCIFWKPDLDQAQRWVPKNERLTRVTFTTGLDSAPYDLVVSTRLFLYRKAIEQVIEATASLPKAITPGPDQESWEKSFGQMSALPSFQERAWEYIRDGSQIDEIERRFLRGTGKSQDGFVSRYLNRPISRRVTRLLLRFPTTPNGWTLLIFLIPIVATLILIRGSYWSFAWGLILFQVFSVLDGCDGEIARAKFLESERGGKLDDIFDVLSNILLVGGLGFGLSAQSAHSGGRFGWLYVVEGVAAAALIGLNEFHLVKQRTSVVHESNSDLLGGALYPRHRQLLERSGLFRLGETFVSWLIQLTKRDVAVLFFVFLAVAAHPALILHLMFCVAAATYALTWRSHSKSQTES